MRSATARIPSASNNAEIVNAGLDEPVLLLMPAGQAVCAENVMYFVTSGNRLLDFHRSNGTSCIEPGNAGWEDYGRNAGAIAGSYTFALSGAGAGAGRSFFRNRVYDLASGRFTQEDPIELPDGLNLYAYAGNNPATYTDPFGLCTPWPDCMFQSIADWGAQRGGAVGSLALNAGAAANAASEAWGANALGAAVANRDVAGGALALAAMLPLGRVAGPLEKGIAKTITGAQGAEVAFGRLGRFVQATWEVAGDKGAGYVRWNKILNNEGSTIRLYKDVYDQGGNYLRRDWYVGGPPK